VTTELEKVASMAKALNTTAMMRQVESYLLPPDVKAQLMRDLEMVAVFVSNVTSTATQTITLLESSVAIIEGVRRTQSVWLHTAPSSSPLLPPWVFYLHHHHHSHHHHHRQQQPPVDQAVPPLALGTLGPPRQVEAELAPYSAVTQDGAQIACAAVVSARIAIWISAPLATFILVRSLSHFRTRIQASAVVNLEGAKLIPPVVEVPWGRRVTARATWVARLVSCRSGGYTDRP
jgi:hypothetical protein